MRYAEYAALVLELQLILSMDTYRWSCFLRSSLSELESDYYDTTNSIRSVTRSFGIFFFLSFFIERSLTAWKLLVNAMTKVAGEFSVNRWNQFDDVFAFLSRVYVPRNDKFCDSRSYIIR